MRLRKSIWQTSRRKLMMETILLFLFVLFLNPMKSYAVEPGQIVYEGPVFTEESTNFYPEEYMEEGGKAYRLISVELQDAEKKGVLTYVSTTIPYELEGDQEPPEMAVITLKDETSGREYEREVHMQGVQEKGLVWREDFSFPITVYGYGADVFFLGGQEVPAGADLSEYGWLFLEYLELPEDCYRIETVEWSGESYEQDGVLCRDAMAYGEKMIRIVDVLYGGQVRTPDIPAKQYVAVYQELVETEEETETTVLEQNKGSTVMEETWEPEEVIHQEEMFSERILRWVREHITFVVFSGLFLVGLAVWALLLYEATKKRKAGN